MVLPVLPQIHTAVSGGPSNAQKKWAVYRPRHDEES